MTPLAWMLGAISLWCLALGVSGAVLDWWEQRHPTVGCEAPAGAGSRGCCDLNDDCPDCQDVRNEQI